MPEIVLAWKPMDSYCKFVQFGIYLGLFHYAKVRNKNKTLYHCHLLPGLEKTWTCILLVIMCFIFSFKYLFTITSPDIYVMQSDLFFLVLIAIVHMT